MYDYLTGLDKALRGLGIMGAVLLVVAGVLMLNKIHHPAVHHEGTYVVIFQAFGAALNCLDVFNYTGFPKDVRVVFQHVFLLRRVYFALECALVVIQLPPTDCFILLTFSRVHSGTAS